MAGLQTFFIIQERRGKQNKVLFHALFPIVGNSIILLLAETNDSVQRQEAEEEEEKKTHKSSAFRLLTLLKVPIKLWSREPMRGSGCNKVEMRFHE